MAPSYLQRSKVTTESTATNSSCRRRLQNNFDECNNSDSKLGDRSVLSIISLNDNTRKVFRNGAERISKTFNTVRTTIGSLTQKFRTSTRRRQILEEGPMTPNPNTTTPQTFSKQILGRTPTKLYSPFGIETPRGKEN